MLVLLIVLSLAGVLTILFCTRWGIGTDTDAIEYVGTAWNLLGGNGFRYGDLDNPISDSRIAAGYPSLLFIIGSFGIDLFVGARWLNALLFGATILLVGQIIRKAAPASFWTPLFGSFLILSSTSMLHIHSYARTEAPFVFFGFLGFYLLSEYLNNQKKWFLVFSGAATALAFLIRYTGATLIVAGLAGIFCQWEKTFRNRLRDSAIFVILSSLPTIFWVAWLQQRGMKTAGGFDRGFRPITSRFLYNGLLTISKWGWPAKDSAAVGIAVLCVLTTITIFVIIRVLIQKRTVRLGGKDSIGRYPPRIALVLAVFLYCYPLLYGLTKGSVAQRLTLNVRHLSPLFVAAVILVLLTAQELFCFKDRFRKVKFACVVFAMAFSSVYVFYASKYVIKSHSEGIGQNKEEYHYPRIMEKIKEFPSDMPIYTNAQQAVSTQVGRWANWLPLRPHYYVHKTEYYSARLYLAKNVRTKGAIFVYFDSHLTLPFILPEEKLKAELPAQLYFSSSEGRIYVVEPKQRPAPPTVPVIKSD